MFPANLHVRAILDALMKETAALGRGGVIPLETIEQISGCPRYTSNWSVVVKHLKRRFLEERNIALWSEPGSGYRLTTLQEQLHMVPYKRLQRAGRQLGRGLREVRALSHEPLDGYDRRVLGLREQAMRQARSSVLKKVRQHSRIMQPQEQAPKPVPVPV